MHCGAEVTESSTNKQHHLSALDAVGDYEADPTVTLEDVPQDKLVDALSFA